MIFATLMFFIRKVSTFKAPRKLSGYLAEYVGAHGPRPCIRTGSNASASTAMWQAHFSKTFSFFLFKKILFCIACYITKSCNNIFSRDLLTTMSWADLTGSDGGILQCARKDVVAKMKSVHEGYGISRTRPNKTK
jgi:hypothetical protein